jgi:hypothetical protein
MMLFFLFIYTSLACTCYHEVTSTQERQYLANSVGFTHITHYDPLQPSFDGDGNQIEDKYQQKVSFKIGSNAFDEMSEYTVKFYPKTPCVLFCLSKDSDIMEIWTTKGRSQFSSRKDAQLSTQFPSHHDYYSFLVESEKELSPKEFGQLKSYSPLERASCCNICCKQVINRMENDLREEKKM